LWADDWTQIRVTLEAAVDLEGLGSLGDIRCPFLRLTDKYQSRESHTSLARGAKSSA
jgi:hypothetical protein